jgi:NitT/TauT family transport system substrate-binding protein
MKAAVKLAARATVLLSVASIAPAETNELRMLEDPETKYAAAPNGVMTYASFMADIGTIKLKPADWKELFFPPVHALSGS